LAHNDVPVDFELLGRPKTMMNKMQKPWFWAAVILMCCATGVFADDSFTLTGVTPGGANQGGVYTSPYQATISGVGSGINVICDDFADEVYFNEQWTVLVTNMASLSVASLDSSLRWAGAQGLTATQQVTDYLTVAFLAAELLSINSDTQEAEDLSFAIWDVFVPSASSGLADSSIIQGYLTAAANQAQTDVTDGYSVAKSLSLDNISNATIYTADPDSGAAVNQSTCSGCGTPQEFITVSMAEPSSPGLLGLDLLGVAGLVLFARRRSAGSANLSRS
jgi:hypothetical protein